MKDGLAEETKCRALKTREKMSAKTISLNFIESFARLVDMTRVAKVGSNLGVENKKGVNHL
jgi:hypothetical protein